MDSNADTRPKPGTTAPRVLITAGPTAEDIDPVRFITNRSTGRMGVEVARAVQNHGGTPLLILGPTQLPPPAGVATIHVRSADQMRDAVLDNLSWCQSLVMAAAVADYTPAEPLDTKLKKKSGDLYLRLKRTTDILSAVKDRPERPGKIVIGFSLDVDVNLDEGRRKLYAKNLDLIVVNTVASFGSQQETAWIVSADIEQNYGDIGKEELAERLVFRILSALGKSSLS